MRAEPAYERTGAHGSYQVEVLVLESTAEYVHVSVAVDDGGWRAFLPICQSLLLYADGRIDR